MEKLVSHRTSVVWKWNGTLKVAGTEFMTSLMPDAKRGFVYPIAICIRPSAELGCTATPLHRCGPSAVPHGTLNHERDVMSSNMSR